MMFSSKAYNLVLAVAAACNAVASATDTVNLLAAENYAILTKAGISTVPDSVITGDIGVSPIDDTSMTGFSFTKDSTGLYAESVQLTGHAYAANFAVPIPADLTTAVSNMEAAYTDAAGRTNADDTRINLGGGILGGIFGGATDPLTPGVYTFGTDVSLDDIFFEGTAADIFIIQTTGNLIQVANTRVTLTGGALAQNIFWQVAGKVVVHAGAHLEGVLLVKSAAIFETSSSLNGRILAQTACTLEKAIITAP